MDKHVLEKLHQLKTLKKVVSLGNIPGSQTSVAVSLLKKLNAEIERLEQLSYEDEHTLRMPSMGILKVSHVLNDTSKYYFQSDISTQSEVQIEIFSASLDKASGNPIKEKLLQKMTMSEKQFADLIINHNRGEGMPVTMTVRDGKPLAPFDPEYDYTKRKMNMLRSGEELTSQTDRFASEVNEALNNCLEKGRASKGDIREIIKTVKNIGGNFKSNASYNVEKLSSETNKRIVEAGVNMHISVNQYALSQGYKLTLENKKEDSKDD
ncbi:hypothetical protein [Vibrio owensii]|uniref:hypothetical protein n=1 Tax=Vibrio harveyi group TaxID=717610 RepID=UPI003CC6B949